MATDGPPKSGFRPQGPPDHLGICDTTALIPALGQESARRVLVDPPLRRSGRERETVAGGSDRARWGEGSLIRAVVRSTISACVVLMRLVLVVLRGRDP